MDHRRGLQRNSAFFKQGECNAESTERGGLSLSRRRDRARTCGTLDLSNFGLEQVTKALMEEIESNEDSESWWEAVNLTELRFSNNNVKWIQDDAFVDVVETVEVVLLDDNKLEEFPLALAVLNRLKKLNLANNRIASFPQQLHMPDLVVLCMSHCALTDVPDTIAGLHSLKLLDLSKCQIRSFCTHLPRSLEKLLLNENEIEYLAESVFSGCSCLRTLDMSKNKLNTLPKSFRHLVNLQHADFRYNKLVSLKDVLPENDSLDQLLLGFNNLESIADMGLSRLVNLTVLDVRENKIAFLPEQELLQCRALKILECSNNNIPDLPVGLGYMKTLQGLHVVGNPLRGIRFSILQAGTEKLKAYLRTRGPAPECIQREEQQEQASKLQSKDPYQALLWESDLLRDATAKARGSGILPLNGALDNDADGEKLALLLEGIARYTMDDEMDGVPPPRPVVDINLSANSLLYVPSLFALQGRPDLTCITSLDLESNLIQSVRFAELAALSSLQRLVLRNNRIDSFLADLSLAGRSAAIPTLRHLDLRQNQLTEIPQTLYLACPALEELLLGYNPIQLFEDRVGSLGNLRVLDLSNARVANFPDSVLLLRFLEYLNLENNAITKIPPELALKQSLKTLLISGNPQRSVRPHVVAEGSAAVLAYLRDRCSESASLPPSQTPPFRVEQPEQITPRQPSLDARQSQEQRASIASSSDSDAGMLHAKISELETKLENDFSLSNAQRYALKKNLAMERAALKRLERSQQSKT